MLIVGWRMGIAIAMLMPPMAAMGAINPWCPGWSAILPVFGFALMVLLGPQLLGTQIQGVEVEIAGGFAGIGIK